MSQGWNFGKTAIAAWVAAGVMAAAVVPAQADVVARISLAQQTMTVFVNGELSYTWKVSTARRGYITPRGAFRAQSLDEMHYSSKYENAPMPYSVFFKGGYAVHGTYETRFLGRPASHGCVRLAPENAATLFSLIQEAGLRDAKIVIN